MLERDSLRMLDEALAVLEQGFAAMPGEAGIFYGHAGWHDRPAERAGMDNLPCAARGAWIAERGSWRLPPARILAQVL